MVWMTLRLLGSSKAPTMSTEVNMINSELIPANIHR